VHASSQSGFLINTPHEFKNAGHTSGRLSFSQPGIAANALGLNISTGCAFGAAIGGSATGVVFVEHPTMPTIKDASKLMRVNDMRIELCGF
jgi:hypothetical protein